MGRLIVLSGLPGTGKSSIARGLALAIGAVWLRIDSIEQAIRETGVVPASIEDAGYRVAHALAEDNLRVGRDVIGDCVNPWMLTRDAWRHVGSRAGAQVVEIELVCSDPDEHRARIERRVSDVPGLDAPNWQAVMARDYQPWDRPRLVVDTSGRDLATSLAAVIAALGAPPRYSAASGTA